MAIVRMRRMRVIMPLRSRRKVLRDLTRLGCIEIETPSLAGQEEEAASLRPMTESGTASRQKGEVTAALAALDKWAPAKSSLFTPKRQVGEQALFDEQKLAAAMGEAEEILRISREISELASQESRLAATKSALAPWTATDIPLDCTGGRSYSVIFGTCPASGDASAVCREAEEKTCSTVKVVGGDNEQQYIIAVCHKSAEDELLELLKTIGFSRTPFKDMKGTAAENVARLEGEISETAARREALGAQLAEKGAVRASLEDASDALSVEALRDAAARNMLRTDQTVYFEGWVPVDAEAKVEGVMADNGCAYEFEDPVEGEEPPTAFKNSRAVEPYSAITELYGLPTYDSIVDPNAFIMVFFVIFFGCMMGDAAYGIIMVAATLWFLKKAKPEGTLRKFMIIGCASGVSSILWGVFLGSWFGDFPTALGKMLGKDWAIPPLLFNPLDDPILMLTVSLVLGVIHLFIGMGLSGYRMIKQGHPLDALFDIGFWYMIILGLAGALLGVPVCVYVAIIGAVGVLFTAGRAKPSIFGKITGGLGALYGVTSYLSDILSYSRLMALCLASGVVAQVFNSLGSLAGNGIPGWILFIIVFVVGQVFNLAIGLLGAFVHTCRLQYVEFFGKFFEAGGRPFKPLRNETKYVQIIKEEM